MDVVVVCGYPCSGKGTFVAERFPNSNWEQITTSDVVRDISGMMQRSNLGTTGHLDQVIAEEIVNRSHEALLRKKSVVIEGIRQYSILESVRDSMATEGCKITVIWLSVSTKELRRRFELRGDKKDDLTFEEAIDSDCKLGLTELEYRLKSDPTTTIIENE